MGEALLNGALALLIFLGGPFTLTLAFFTVQGAYNAIHRRSND